MIGRRIFYLLSLLASLAYYLFVGEWFSYILFIIVLILPLLSLSISLKPMLQTRLCLKIAAKVERESEVFCLIDAKCPAAVPPFRCKIKVCEANGGQSYLLRVGEPLPTKHCNGLTLSLHRPKVYDYLGLFSKRIRQNEPIKVCIMPKPAEIALPSDLSGSVSQSLRPKQGGGFSENHEIRPYRPGDMLGLVHWKISEKVSSLMIREPLVPTDRLFSVFLELCGTPSEIDSKLGQLLWLGSDLAEKGLSFEVIALTGKGQKKFLIHSEFDVIRCIEALLFLPFWDKSCQSGDVPSSAKYIHIGGEDNEK